MKKTLSIAAVLVAVFGLGLLATNHASAYQYNPSSLTVTSSSIAAALPDPLNVNTLNATTSIQALGTSTASIIQDFDNILYVPKNYTTSTYGDFGQYLLNWYNQMQTVASSVLVMYPPGLTIPSAGFTTDANFANDGERITINCVPGGGSKINYGGSGTAFTWNTGSGTGAGGHRNGYGMNGCYLVGPSGTGSTGGIFAGGTLGAEGIWFYGNTIKTFGTCFETGANIWELYFGPQNFVSGCNTLAKFDSASNSGERFDIEGNNFFDPPGPNASSVILFSGSSVASAWVSGNSFDDAGTQIAAGNLSIVMEGNHWENPGHTSYSPFVYVDVLSSTGTNVQWIGGTFMNDATTTAESPGGGLAYINCGAICSFQGVTFDRNGSATTTVYGVTNTNSLTNAKITMCNTVLVATPFGTAPFKNGGVAVTSNDGCLYGIGNNYPAGWQYYGGGTSANTSKFYGSNNGVALNVTGNIAGSGTGVSWFFGGDQVGSSTVHIGGTLSAKLNIFSASTTLTGDEAGSAGNSGYLTYIYNGTDPTTKIILPRISSTSFRLYAGVNRGTSVFVISATSTDLFAIGAATSVTYTVTRGGSFLIQNDGISRWNFISRSPQRYITPSISGVLAGLGCDSATTTVDTWLTTSTADSASFSTSPTTFPGNGFYWLSYLSGSGLMTTVVCADVAGTPTASTYTVTLQ